MKTTLTTAAHRNELAGLIPEFIRAEGVTTWNALLAFADCEATEHLRACDAQRLLKKRAKRRPVPFYDNRGELVLRIPLDDKGSTFALVDACDWIEMQALGINGLWVINTTAGRPYVKMWRPMAGRGGKANMLTVARLILGIGPRQQVRFRNGDTLDLRRCNLSTVTSVALPGARPAHYDAVETARSGIKRRIDLVVDRRSRHIAAMRAA